MLVTAFVTVLLSQACDNVKEAFPERHRNE